MIIFNILYYIEYVSLWFTIIILFSAIETFNNIEVICSVFINYKPFCEKIKPQVLVVLLFFSFIIFYYNKKIIN